MSTRFVDLGLEEVDDGKTLDESAIQGRRFGNFRVEIELNNPY